MSHTGIDILVLIVSPAGNGAKPNKQRKLSAGAAASASASVDRNEEEQVFLDAGQKSLGPRHCPKCNTMYSVGVQVGLVCFSCEL